MPVPESWYPPAPSRASSAGDGPPREKDALRPSSGLCTQASRHPRGRLHARMLRHHHRNRRWSTGHAIASRRCREGTLQRRDSFLREAAPSRPTNGHEPLPRVPAEPRDFRAHPISAPRRRFDESVRASPAAPERSLHGTTREQGGGHRQEGQAAREYRSRWRAMSSPSRKISARRYAWTTCGQSAARVRRQSSPFFLLYVLSLTFKPRAAAGWRAYAPGATAGVAPVPQDGPASRVRQRPQRPVSSTMR